MFQRTANELFFKQEFNFVHSLIRLKQCNLINNLIKTFSCHVHFILYDTEREIFLK